MLNKNYINPSVCPLCGAENNCMNDVDGTQTKNCWCNSQDIKFPSSLLEQVPAEARKKACICLTCASKYTNNVVID